MTSSLKPQPNSEQGFTLIELLVVILVIGTLAGLALPAFLRQQQKGQDGAAKSNARNLVSQMHACYEEEDGFVGCRAMLTPGITNLPIGDGPGRVRITEEGLTGYVIEATSKALTGENRHTFTISWDQSGGARNTCLPIERGGCPEDVDGDGLGDW